MKLKSTILATLAAAAILTGCNKEEGVTTAPENGGTSSMLFKIELPQTRAIEPGAPLEASEIKSMYVYAETAAGVVLKTYELTTAEIAAAQNTDPGEGPVGAHLEQVPNAATDVRVAANYDGKGDRITSADTGIAAFQEGIVNVPYVGKGKIVESTEPNGDGHKLVKAAVSISPVAARFEISGGINVVTEVGQDGNLIYKHGVYAVDVEAVYINNYRHDIKDLDALHTTKGTTVYDDSGTGNWTGEQFFVADSMWNKISTSIDIENPNKPISGSYYATDHNLGIVTGKVAAYQFFPKTASKADKATVGKECPHIVLKVKVYLTEADYLAKTEANDTSLPNKWITITSFKKGNNLISNFEAGKIYKLNLDALTSSFKPNPNEPDKPITPTDPNPEEPKSDLTLTVTVTPWTEEIMTPDI